jgi:hypothetical protein
MEISNFLIRATINTEEWAVTLPDARCTHHRSNANPEHNPAATHKHGNKLGKATARVGATKKIVTPTFL